MLIPLWILVTSIVIVGVVIVGLCLVMRRALNELFFWRGAFKCTSDRACMLLAQASHVETGVTPAAVVRNAPVRQNGDVDRSGDRALEDGRSEVLLRRYQGSLDAVMHTASAFKIDWVSDADADYFRDQYGPVDDPGDP